MKYIKIKLILNNKYHFTYPNKKKYFKKKRTVGKQFES